MSVIEGLVATTARVGERGIGAIVGTAVGKHRDAPVVRLGALTMADKPVRGIDGGVYRWSWWIRIAGRALDGDLSIVVEPSIPEGASLTVGVVLWDTVHQAGTTIISRNVTPQHVPTEDEITAELEAAVDALRQLEERWDEVLQHNKMVEKIWETVAALHQREEESKPEWDEDVKIESGDPDGANTFLTQLKSGLQEPGRHASPSSAPSPSEPSQ